MANKEKRSWLPKRGGGDALGKSIFLLIDAAHVIISPCDRLTAMAEDFLARTCTTHIRILDRTPTNKDQQVQKKGLLDAPHHSSATNEVCNTLPHLTADLIVRLNQEVVASTKEVGCQTLNPYPFTLNLSDGCVETQR